MPVHFRLIRQITIASTLAVCAGCATAHGPARINDPQRLDRLSDWSRVKELSEGARIVVVTSDQSAVDAIFIRVTDAQLVTREPKRSLSTQHRFNRDAIAEIRGPVRVRGSIGGAILGGWLGFSVGLVPGVSGVPVPVAWLTLAGSIAGGTYLGHHLSSHSTDGIVYRAPAP